MQRPCLEKVQRSRHGSLEEIDKRITHLLRVATRHGGLYFLRDHFLFLTVGDLLGGGGDCFLLKLLGFGICAQIFVGRGGAGGDCLGSDIRTRRFACNIGLLVNGSQHQVGGLASDTSGLGRDKAEIVLASSGRRLSGGFETTLMILLGWLH